ncbi:MAG: pilus assembly protein [Atopobiaceae bacterium]|nr:pilus assembly protein [Atopobiaceae bacterium]
MILPSVMLLLALLLQPVCLSYTRAIMRGAAGECARAAVTAYGGDTSACEAYALRRLRAVPQIPLFHVGGEGDWQLDISRSSSHVSVTITGHARPLPLMGAMASLLSKCDDVGVVLRVSVDEDTRASWVGGDYSGWQSIWG